MQCDTRDAAQRITDALLFAAFGRVDVEMEGVAVAWGRKGGAMKLRRTTALAVPAADVVQKSLSRSTRRSDSKSSGWRWSCINVDTPASSATGIKQL